MYPLVGAHMVKNIRKQPNRPDRALGLCCVVVSCIQWKKPFKRVMSYIDGGTDLDTRPHNLDARYAPHHELARTPWIAGE